MARGLGFRAEVVTGGLAQGGPYPIAEVTFWQRCLPFSVQFQRFAVSAGVEQRPGSLLQVAGAGVQFAGVGVLAQLGPTHGCVAQ